MWIQIYLRKVGSNYPILKNIIKDKIFDQIIANYFFFYITQENVNSSVIY